MFDKRITLEKELMRTGRRLQNYYTRRPLPGLSWLIGLLLIVTAAGCVRLPDYARPRFYRPEQNTAARHEGFGYRQLAIEDFQATALPPAYSAHHHRINAHSCISIRPAPDTKGRITQGQYQGRPFFVGSIPAVCFEAVFVPSCSWWSPAIPEGRKAYVLEHEQIHFGLAELAARRLTLEAEGALQGYLAVNDSYKAVQDELVEKMMTLARDAMAASFEEHTNFDEETSLYFDPQAQRRWLEAVQTRLVETPEK